MFGRRQVVLLAAFQRLGSSSDQVTSCSVVLLERSQRRLIQWALKKAILSLGAEVSFMVCTNDQGQPNARQLLPLDATSQAGHDWFSWPRPGSRVRWGCEVHLRREGLWLHRKSGAMGSLGSAAEAYGMLHF